MKFKQLMFEDLGEYIPTNMSAVDELYDDDFSTEDFVVDSQITNVPEGPQMGSDTGVADMLLDAINDEIETIRKYNSMIATLRVELINNPVYDSFINVLNDINEEENVHVGQLQEMLKQISPNASSIQRGIEEGSEQLHFKEGKLQVQSWDSVPSSQSEKTTPNEIDTMCMLNDVDDEM